jgi:hypothetical protein
MIAVTRNVAISQLLAEIDRTMRLQPARISPSTHAQRRDSGLRTADAHCTTFKWGAGARSSSQRRSAAYSSRRARSHSSRGGCFFR